MPKQLLKVSEVAERLDISIDAIRKLCDEGVLKPIRSKGNHRLFDVRDVVALQKIDNIDYVAKAKKLRQEKLSKVELLDNELKKFTGTSTGVKLQLYEKLYKSCNGNVDNWSIIKNEDATKENSAVIFIAKHFEGDVFEYKCFPLYSDKKTVFAISTMLMGQNVEVPKIQDTQKGSLSDLLQALVSQIARM